MNTFYLLPQMEDLPTKFALNVDTAKGAATTAAGTNTAVSCARLSLPLNYVTESNHLEHPSDNCTVGSGSVAAAPASSSTSSSLSHHTSSWLAALHVRNNNTNMNHSQNGQQDIPMPSLSVSNSPIEQRCTHKSQSVWECFTCSCQTISLAKMKHNLAETNGACSNSNRVSAF